MSTLKYLPIVTTGLLLSFSDKAAANSRAASIAKGIHETLIGLIGAGFTDAFYIAFSVALILAMPLMHIFVMESRNRVYYDKPMSIAIRVFPWAVILLIVDYLIACLAVFLFTPGSFGG